MLDISILITFLILMTLLAVRFGWQSYIGIFSNIVFLTGILFVIAFYIYNRPKLEITFQPVMVKKSLLTNLFEMKMFIHDKAITSHHYQEAVLYPEKGTMINNPNEEIVRAYVEDKETPWPYTQGFSIPLNELQSDPNQSLVYPFYLLVPQGQRQTEINVNLDLHRNEYSSGLTAIFNPILKYRVKKTVPVDLTTLLDESNPASPDND